MPGDQGLAVGSKQPRRSGSEGRVVAGFGAQGVSALMMIAGQLASVPVLLDAWGADRYADWLVLAAVSGLMPLTDGGASGYLGNTLRRAWARGDSVAGTRVLRSGLGFYAMQVAIVGMVLLLVAVTVDTAEALHLGHLERPTETLLLLCLAALLLIPRGFLANLHSAHGNLPLEVLGVAMLYAAMTAAVLVTAALGGSPMQAATCQLAVATIIGWGALLINIRRSYPGVCVSPVAPTMPEMLMLARKAPFYLVGHSGFRILLHLPVVLLGQFGSNEAVVTFTTIRTYAGLVRQTALQFGLSAGIEMAALVARGEAETARRLYLDTVVPLAVLVGLLSAFAWAAGPDVLQIWTSGRIAFDPAVGAVFLGGALLLAPSAAPIAMLRFMDRPEVVAAAQGAEVVVALVAVAAMVSTFGALGAAIAVVAAECLVSVPWLFRAAQGVFGPVPPRIITKALAAGVIGVAGLMVTAAGVHAVSSLTGIWGLGLLAALAPLPGLPLLLLSMTPAQRRKIMAWVRHSRRG